jgi:hypothetical protein
VQKLEELEVTKVAFVPEGDNRKADILLFKSKPEGADSGEGTKSTDVSKSDDDKETKTLKRFFLALAKGLGFEKADEEPDDDDDDGDGDGASGEPAVNGDGDGNTNNDLPDDDDETGKAKTQKGVTADMKFDKSKLTAEEIAQLEAIEKKAGISEDGGAADDGVQKNNSNDAADSNSNDDVNKNKPETDDADDIYKGLNPIVAAELKDLRKRADAAEERELLAVAKKYELLGKKPEELAVTLKTLKKAGGTAYDDMIGVLDASLAAVEQSGAFSEIGKSGNGGKADPWAQIENHAAEIQKAKPDMTWNQAVEKACEQHPELVAEYEQKR